jgi:hypothetical protein
VSYDLTPDRTQLVATLETSQITYVLVAPAIRWQHEYQTAYSERAIEMLAAVERLVAEGRMRLAYVGDDGIVRGYEWQGTRRRGNLPSIRSS